MYKSILSLITLCLFLSSCKREQDPFEISKQHIGLLTDSTQVKDLKTVFINDSISTYTGNNKFSGNINNIIIYNKSGAKSLVLTPNRVLDSTSTITSIQIIDPLYKTEKGISTTSTFKDINSAYKISKIDNQINSIGISIKEMNARFVIDKKELPANLRFDSDLKFEKTHIPDDAKIKYFFLFWND